MGNDTKEIWYPDGTVKVTEIDVDKQLIAAIQGGPKTGKSNLAVSGKKGPKWVADPLSRLVSLQTEMRKRNITDIYGKSYPDSPKPNVSVAWDKMIEDVGMFEYQKSQGNPLPGVYVIDDMDAIADRAMRKFLATHKADPDIQRAALGIGIQSLAGQEYLYPAGFSPFTNSVMMVKNYLEKFMELGSDVIAIFHERPEEEEVPGGDSKGRKLMKITGKKTVTPPRLAALLPMFNEYWRMDNDGSTYRVYMKAGEGFDGATCLDVDEVEEANLTNIINKHHQRTKEKEQQNNGKSDIQAKAV